MDCFYYRVILLSFSGLDLFVFKGIFIFIGLCILINICNRLIDYIKEKRDKEKTAIKQKPIEIGNKSPNKLSNKFLNSTAFLKVADHLYSYLNNFSCKPTKKTIESHLGKDLVLRNSKYISFVYKIECKNNGFQKAKPTVLVQDDNGKETVFDNSYHAYFDVSDFYGLSFVRDFDLPTISDEEVPDFTKLIAEKIGANSCCEFRSDNKEDIHYFVIAKKTFKNPYYSPSEESHW